MKRYAPTRILANNSADDLIGRSIELDHLLDHANNRYGSTGLVLLAAPSAGATELIRQAYDRMFAADGDVIPFYFEIRESDLTAQNAAARFLNEFLLQTVAFRRRDPRIIFSSPELSEIAELASPSDGYWIDRLIEAFDRCDERSFSRHCLSAPLRAAANGALSFVMIDDAHLAERLIDGRAFFEAVTDVFSKASTPFLISGHRRSLFAKTPFKTMNLDPLSVADSGKLAESLAAKMGVVINDQTRDLVAVQLGGNTGHIVSLFSSAAAAGAGLNSFELVQKAYTDAIFGGRISRHFDDILESVCPETARRSLLELLSENLTSKIPVDYWKKHFGGDVEAVLEFLNGSEIIDVNSGMVEIAAGKIVLRDYIRARARLEIDGEARALAVGDSLSSNISRAPELMSRHYRRSSAIGLGELMRSFDGRSVSRAIFDYGRFSRELKGAGDETIARALHEDIERITLPRIVFTASTSAFYPPLNEFCDTERSAVAQGFTEQAGKEDVVWIAVEIDSKLEATREQTEFWCDRLEIAALHCDFAQYVIWLVAPEGFMPDALDILNDRNAFGSSRRQAAMLAKLLDADVADPRDKKTGNEYEITLPMGDDTEMLAARTVEDIARHHDFPAKAVNQIKTAVVEACINAAEHSLSPDQKTHLKFVVDDNTITITVWSRGVRLADKPIRNPDPTTETRRGWGLKLIEGLMDDVSIDRTDDGTKITMVKFLKTPDLG
jgi:serine/threonine-protein kinase RsbW